MGPEGYFSRNIAAGVVGHSLSSSFEVGNAWKYTFTSPIYLGMQMASFTSFRSAGVQSLRTSCMEHKFFSVFYFVMVSCEIKTIVLIRRNVLDAMTLCAM